MSTTDLMQRYGGILASLGTDVVSILVLSGFLYYRRHWRSDLLLAYIALNIGIFVTMALLTQVKVDLAVGFGLFAILSIVRLRSSAVTQQEVAYYFLALVLGLVNGLGVPDRALAIGMNLVLLAAMWLFDSKRLRERAQRMDVRLDGVFTDVSALLAELERKLGRQVGYYEIMEVDLIHGHMLIDVRLRPGEGVIVPPHEKGEKNGHHHASADATQETTPVPAGPVGMRPTPHPHPDGYRGDVSRHTA